ncbi:hypothetical protein RB598_006523 [Gaeumannomyces tritici]
MSATQAEAEPEDHTVKGLALGLQGLSLRQEPVVTHEAAQTQTGSSRASLPAAMVDPARPSSPSASVSNPVTPFPYESASMASPVSRQMGGKKGAGTRIVIPRIPTTDDNDDQALFGDFLRTNTLTTVSTNTPHTPVTRTSTWSSLASVDTVASSPTGDYYTMDEQKHPHRLRYPLIPLDYLQSYIMENPVTSEFGSDVANSRVPIKSSISKTHDLVGSYLKSERSVHMVDTDVPKPLATRKTMPHSRGLRETTAVAPKLLVSHSTFPLASPELTAREASFSPPRHSGPTLAPEKGITGILGPIDLPTRSLSLAQLRKREAGLSGEAKSEDRVMQFVQDQGCRSQSLRDTPESRAPMESDGTSSNHIVGHHRTGATQPRTSERPATSKDASTSAPESENSLTAQLVPSTIDSGCGSVSQSYHRPDAAQPRTPKRPATSKGGSTSTPESEDSPPAQPTPSTSDSGSDQGVESSVVCEELAEDSQDRFTQNIYAVIVQHTPGLVLDELDQSLKELADRCVERAANLTQATLNKRAASIAAAAFSGDSLPHSTEPPPCDASPSSHPANAGGGGGSFGQGQEQANHRKRKDPSDGSPDKGSSSQEDDSGKDNQGAELRTSSEVKLLSCPFRKRNPFRFNVRAYDSCACQGHADMARLKRHVKIYHSLKNERKNQCGRCMLVFETDRELKEHLRQVNRCNLVDVDVGNRDPEDGITKDIEDRINGRKKGLKVDTWEALWALLFPEDTIVLSSEFAPVVESFDVWHEFHLDDGGFPPLKSKGSDCERYVESKFKSCMEDPTKERKDHGGVHLSIIESGGAPVGAAPRRQQTRPDWIPATPGSSSGPSGSPTANREPNGRNKRRCPQPFPPVPSHGGVGNGGPPPSEHIATPNLAFRSSSYQRPLAPRPQVTAHAEEAAASSTAQLIPLHTAALATRNQGHYNGMGHHNTTNGGLGTGMASGEFAFDEDVTDWLEHSNSMIGMGEMMSAVAAGKQREVAPFMRRPSSSAATVIPNGNMSPPPQQQQQQREQQQRPMSFTPGMGSYSADTRLLVSHAAGGGPDGPYNNSAMCSGASSQMPTAATAAPTAAMATMADGVFQPFSMGPAGYGEQYIPPGTTAALPNPDADYMNRGATVTYAGDLNLGGMSQLIPSGDQSGSYTYAQRQDDVLADSLHMDYDMGITSPVPHDEAQFQSSG